MLTRTDLVETDGECVYRKEITPDVELAVMTRGLESIWTRRRHGFVRMKGN